MVRHDCKLIHIKDRDRDIVYVPRQLIEEIMMFSKILVGFDGSNHAVAALRIAADLATKYQARLMIAHAPESNRDAVAVGSEMIFVPITETDIQARAGDVLAQGMAIATQAGHADATTTVLRGNVAEAILTYAMDENIDLIVAGRRGMGMLHALLVGSVSQKLTAHAACPVLTVQ